MRLVSVVVPARQCADTLPRAVASALAQAGPDAAVEVAVAVGPSTDGTLDVARHLEAEHPEVHVIENPSGRTPDALNLAIGATTGPVVVRLDAHAVLPGGYVDVALEALDRTGAGNVGGVQEPVADDGFAAAVASAMRSPVGTGGATYRSGDRAGPTDTVYLGVFRRAALEAVGGFDPRLVRNQDYELNVRLRDAGWTVWFDPRLRVAYRPRSTVGGLARQYFQYGRWKRVVLRLHPSSVRLRQLAAPVLVVGLAVTLAAWPLVGPLPAGVVLGTYATVLVGGAIVVDARRLPGVVVALTVMHLAWGVGFLLPGEPRGAGA